MLSRTEFLAAGAAASSIVAASGTPAGAAEPAILTEAAFIARLRSPAKHKQLFVSPRVHDGSIFSYTFNTLQGFQQGWNEPAGALFPVGILVGSAAMLALNDEAWKTLKLRALVGAYAGDFIRAASDGNPYLHASPDGAHDRSIEALMRRGAAFFVCDTALLDVSRTLIAANAAPSSDPLAVRFALRRFVVDGIGIVPAGVSAAQVAQENGFRYFFAAV